MWSGNICLKGMAEMDAEDDNQTDTDRQYVFTLNRPIYLFKPIWPVRKVTVLNQHGSLLKVHKYTTIDIIPLFYNV